MKGLDQQDETSKLPVAVQPGNARALLTIPNILCWIRLAGALVLFAIALLNRDQLFLWCFVFFAMTDWFDGKLAILLNQRTEFGARLDSWADAALFTALLFGAVLLRNDKLVAELLWVIPAICSYLISTAAGFWKYRRWPSYHTRAAKTSWFFTLVGAIGLFSDWLPWLLRIALLAVTLTNLEALLITIISPRWRANVSSVYHAWRYWRRLTKPKQTDIE